MPVNHPDLSLKHFYFSRFAVPSVYIILTGFGLGVTLPIYIIAAQNAVPYKVMGVVVSSVPFSRFMGGTFGLAILGSIMSHHFVSEFLSKVPPEVRSAISSSDLSVLAQNPQALISQQAQIQLQNILTRAGVQSDFNQILSALRESLVSAIAEVFLITMVIVIGAFILNLFIKEIPLRKRQNTPTAE